MSYTPLSLVSHMSQLFAAVTFSICAVVKVKWSYVFVLFLQKKVGNHVSLLWLEVNKMSNLNTI
jgi:hypothetical protein